MQASVKKFLGLNKMFHETSNGELDDIMSHIPKYLGAHGNDWVMGKKPQKEMYLILNLENENQGGTHWVCVCNKPDYPYIEYFDSFGMPMSDQVEEYMGKSGKLVAGNTNEIQNYKSQACGYYCINYLKMRYAGVDPYDILYSFRMGSPSSKVTMRNDDILLKELKGKKILPKEKIQTKENMVQVSVYDHKGNHLTDGEVPMKKEHVKKVLKSLPKGKKRVHVVTGNDKTPVTLDVDAKKGNLMLGKGSDGDNALSFFNNLLSTLGGVAAHGMNSFGSMLPKMMGMGFDPEDGQSYEMEGSGTDADNALSFFNNLIGTLGGVAAHGMNSFGSMLPMMMGMGLGRDTLQLQSQLIKKREDEALALKRQKSKARDKSKIELTQLQKERIRKETQALIRQTVPTKEKTIKGHKIPAREGKTRVLQDIHGELNGGPKAKKPTSQYNEFVRHWMGYLKDSNGGHLSVEQLRAAMKVLGSCWSNKSSQTEIQQALSSI